MPNFDWVNQKPSEYTKETWQYLYAEYCKTQMFGPKTKKEYYDMVMENFRKMDERNKPISQELLDQWTRGRRAAKAWARQHGCDLNGRLLSDVRAEADDRSTREIAERAEDMAVESVQRIDDFVESIRRRRVQQ